MSDPGKGADASEDFEDVVDETEDGQGRDGAGSDDDGADAGDADDAGGEADAGDADASGEDEGQAGKSAEVKPLGRGERAVLEAKRIAKEAKAEADATRAELNRLQQERHGRTLAEQQAEERAKLELMSPDDKLDYLLRKQEQGFSGALNQLRFEQADGKDQSRFESLCARTPAFSAIADEVEAELQKMRRGGSTAPRETIATYLIGKKAVERASKGGKAKQAAKGSGRVQSERVAAPATRSEAPGGAQRRSGSDAAKRADRLKDIQI